MKTTEAKACRIHPTARRAGSPSNPPNILLELTVVIREHKPQGCPSISCRFVIKLSLFLGGSGRERISMNHYRTQTDQTGLVSHHGFFNMAADPVAASTGFSCSCFHLAFSVKTCGLVQTPKILVIKWQVSSG